MEISVIIPTCNRKASVHSLLENLNRSIFILKEVIIVDSGDDRLLLSDFSVYNNLRIRYISSERSVCVQRNTGIRLATSEWIFICDDDIEPPPGYLTKLAEHINLHPEAGAVSGLVMQKGSAGWVSNYPVRSGLLLLWKYIFQLSIWGPLQNKSRGFIMRRIKEYYQKKGNHLSKTGWPVITNFSGSYFETPLYGLGASLIKKEWLLNAPFDEVLDSHGIGDNYGVAAKFPGTIHVLNDAFVYHHQKNENRLQYQVTYYRRALALDYFRQTIPSLKYVQKRWLLWSLTGNLFYFILTVKFYMLMPAAKTIFKILFGKNPYLQAASQNIRITEPSL